MTERLAVAACLLALLAGGFLYFPGHTYLQSDTQIYLPILDRLADQSLYAKDPVALRPHVSFTLYDEAALALRRWTGLSFEHALQAQQLLYRFAGLVGVFLLGRACGLATSWALLLASIFGLGATIVGPAVLTVEYEPVPRGFAVPLLILAAGLAANDRWTAAGAAAGLAILYHPPTAIPMLVAGAVAIWRSGGRWRAVVLPVAMAVTVAVLFNRFQAGETEPQRLWSAIGPELERLQRLRGSYNFIGIWGGRWAGHWLFVFAVAGVAWWRLRASVPRFVSTLAGALLAYAAASVPVSYLLLEKMKWSLMPQFQPMRALLWVTVLAMLGAALQGIRAAQVGQWTSVLWFSIAYGLSGQLELAKLPWFAVSDVTLRARLLVFVALGIVAFASVRFARPALVLALALPFWLIPQAAKVRNYPALDHPEIHALAGWARANSAKDDVFQFPDAGQALYPGLFRVYAQRAVYVDWKVGGQVNLLAEFADEWWRRWQIGGAPAKVDIEKLAAAGIQWVVLHPKNALAGEPAYRNDRYVVYRIAR